MHTPTDRPDDPPEGDDPSPRSVARGPLWVVAVLVALGLVAVVWQLASPGGHRPAAGEVYVYHHRELGYYGVRVVGVRDRLVDYERFECDAEGEPLPGSTPPRDETWYPRDVSENDVPPPRVVGHEWREVSGVRFKCAVLREPRGSVNTYKAWEARLNGRCAFPGTVRDESLDGELRYELVKVVLPR